MDKEIYTKLDNVLKAECDYVMQHEEDITVKFKKMNILFNLKKILENYDELEEILAKFFEDKAQKDKFER